MKSRHALLGMAVLAAGVLLSARLVLQADDARAPRNDREQSKPNELGPRLPGPIVDGAQLPPERARFDRPERSTGRETQPTVQDWLQQPFAFPFREPTSLTEVVRYLRETLKAPVVLDLAALKRLDITADERVQLDLQGVRMKTGLKLLLDQVDLTYKVVPEDNLLVLTDARGADDPADRVLSELKSLHRDVHDLQDAVDDLRADLMGDEEGGPRMRKPTIIEELPGEAGAKPAAPPETRPGRPRT